MTIKEKPLLDAVEKLGPLPGFLDSNLFFLGFFSMFMCAVFGIVLALFQASGRGFLEMDVLFDAAAAAAMISLLIATPIFGLIGASAFVIKDDDERAVRLKFAAGGAACLLMMVVATCFWFDDARAFAIYSERYMGKI